MKKMLGLLAVLLMLCFSAAFAEEAAETTETVYHGSTYSSCGYSITLKWQEGIEEDAELREELLKVFFDRYPAIRETYGTNEDRTVTLYLNDDGVDYISVDGIYMDYTNLKEQRRAMNTLVWFFANKVANGHPNPEKDPEIDVLSLGVQNYIENVYAVDPETAVWLMPYEEGQQLTDNHQVAGAFIKWVADTFGAEIPVRLNRVLHEGYYDSHDFWLKAAGNTLENLWIEYSSRSVAE